ncbi:hypothetical protein C0J50_20745 [Silurus asotus]|uniref:RING-type E3 ubiquitin transferase n=1 Tax=Silurus asotus TaxID=30991 RepID=A0AAD5FK67_SILAS|nr:hypothetical protein C0J50_20745 [Silurus asotus]
MDGSETRLVDKLQIHFLRKKNGGGEISSVTVSKATPGTAFITFEEPEVASRLARKGKQVFKVNDRNYDITISLHHGEVAVDKVLLRMTVLVDHRRLPQGKNTLLSLHRAFPDVRLVFDDQKHLCTVNGRYSDVQTLSSLVLDSLETQDQSPSDAPQLPPEEPTNIHFGANEDVGELKNTPVSADLDLDLEHKTKRKSGLPLPCSYSDQASCAALTDDTWNSSATIGTSFEDFSLIVDSDIFRYLHKYCSVDYQSILRRHSVEVLDVNCDDITTLYLKPQTARSEHDLGSVKKAHEDLAKLYQHQESQLRKEQVFKPDVPEKELARALESLRMKMPRLMIDVEDRNVYMVGSKSEVSEAKQFIGDLQGFGMGKDVFASSQTRKQGSAAASDPPGVFSAMHQDSHELFMPKKDLQDTNQIKTFGESSSRRTHCYAELKETDDVSQSGQFTSSQRSENSTEDIFSLRKTDVPQARHVPSDPEWMELEKNKYTDSHFQFSNPSAPLDFTSGGTDLQSQSDVRGTYSETLNKLSKEHKNKQTESGKERKLAANFGSQDSTSYKSDPPKLNEGSFEKEKLSDSGHPHPHPLIKPSMTSSLDPNTLRGIMSAKATTRKLDLGHDKKTTLTSAGLSGDQGVRSRPTIPTSAGSPLRRSNSFSGRIQKGENKTQVAEDLSAGQKGLSGNSPTREIAAMDLVLPFKLWLYLTSVYNTEIENMTSDLQVKEILGEDGLTLCLKGVDSEKVYECHRRLKSFIATAEMDFEARTVPLSDLQVSDNKDKTLIELCILMKQRFKMVKLLAMSSDLMILGPRSLCEEVEAAMIKTLKSSPGPASLHTSRASNSDFESLGNQPTASAKPDADVVQTSDPKNAQSATKVLHEDNKCGTQTLIQEESDQKDGGITNKNRGTSCGELIQKNKADGESKGDDTSSSQSDQTVTEQPNPDVSPDRRSAAASNHHLFCYVCAKECETVKQAACSYNFCTECDKKVHNNCGICVTSGIKGSMSIQESTLTIPGFTRDTTLKIIYDIPDGIQGEEHPCPGAPFKGDRFEAFLPLNKTTKKLLPLLEKAFHQGLTFTVKEGSSDDDGSKEGRVVWGSIPHKTKTEGGTSKKGYPDSTYIRRLDDALKAAGVAE